MNVLFVYPNIVGISAIQIGIAVLSAVLKSHGHTVDLFDTTFLCRGTETDAFEKHISKSRPDIICYSIRSTEFALAAALNRRIERYQIPAVAGGPHPTLSPNATAAEFGLVIQGEAERALPLLLNNIAAGGGVENTPNLTFKINKRDEFVTNGLIDLIDVNQLPYPDWDLFDERHIFDCDFKKYSPKGSKCVGIFEKSRGCPNKCTYCSVPAIRAMYKGLGKWRRTKDTDVIVNEIVAFKEKYPVDHVHFIDDMFLTTPRKMKKLRDTFKNRVGVSCSTSERSESMNDEAVKMFSEMGGYKLWVGVESGDEDLRKNSLKRNMGNDTIIRAFQTARRYGVKAHATMMVGLPTQDDESYLKTYDLVGKLHPDGIQYSIFYPFLGTELYDYCVVNGYYKNESELYGKSFRETSALTLPSITRRKIVRYQRILTHMGVEYSKFKRLLVHWSGLSELAFTLIFVFYMGPRIFYKNRQWFSRLGIWRSIARVAGIYT